MATTMAAYRRYMRGLVDDKVREPGDDLASDLIAIHREVPGAAHPGRDQPRSCSRCRSPGTRPPPGSSGTPSAACSRTPLGGRISSSTRT